MRHTFQNNPSHNIWIIVWKLVRLRIVILFSSFRHAALRRKIGISILVILLIAFLGFVFYLGWKLLQFLQSPQVLTYFADFQPLLASIPGIIIVGAFLGILLTSFGVLLQALYLAGDMDFLLSAPVPIRAVFITKLLQAILPNFAIICLFALPLLFGIGATFDYSWIYYPMVIITLIALASAAAGLSAILVMIVVRVFPARRVAEILGFFGAISAFLCSQSGQLMNISDLSQDQTSQALSMLSRFDVAWSPLAWVGRGLTMLGGGDYIQGFGYILPVLVASGLMFALSLVSSERLYYSGWASVQSQSGKIKVRRPTRAKRTTPLQVFVEKIIPSTVRSIIVKDWLVLRRDLRNMSQLITPLIFGVIYAIMFFRNGNVPTPGSDIPTWMAEVLKNVSVYINVGISLFVGWMLLARLAGMGFSQEGKQYWVIKSSPVGTRSLIVSKYIVAFLPTVALGWGFLVVISLVQGASLMLLFFTIPVVTLCVAGNTGINLTFGITGANFDWEDPRKMQRGGHGCLASLASIIYLPISLMLFFGPTILLTALGLPETVGQVVGIIIGGLFSLVCGFIPLYWSSKRVPMLAEPS